MHVLELLYNFQKNRYNLPTAPYLKPEEYKYWLRWCFDNASSNTIQAKDIYRIYMTWEKYHNNQIWCEFAVEESMEDQMLNGSKVEQIEPLFRLDATTMLKMLQWKEDDIPCELFVKKITHKYIHIKARTRLIDD